MVNSNVLSDYYVSVDRCEETWKKTTFLDPFFLSSSIFHSVSKDLDLSARGIDPLTQALYITRSLSTRIASI